MAVGKNHWPQMYPVNGIQLGAAQANIKYTNRDDITVISINKGATVAGVFTQNAFCAAPVYCCRNFLPKGDIRYFLINSGNANACTGEQGLQDALETCRALAELREVEARQVLPFSTGVIGELLPVEKIKRALPKAVRDIQSTGWQAAAEAIMTTDTRPKGSSVQFIYKEETFTVTGIAKGSGMIKPNMATMLAFIATDAAVAQPLLNHMVKRAADLSFNCISVDGDTSTNDACMLVATGRASNDPLMEPDGELYDLLMQAVVQVSQDLAQAIVKDGEGASKFVTIQVMGGDTDKECRIVANAIAQSPLVKTAFFASDPNWGRIVAAIGYAGVTELDATQVKLWLNDVLVVENGGRAASYTEEAGQTVIELDTFTLRVDLGRGDSRVELWTTDLSHEYIRINAEYRS